MIAYESAVIYQFADRLYKRASGIVVSYTLLGFLLGAGGAYAAMGGKSENAVALVGAIVAVIGYALGSERAFTLKLQAQTALCQVQIEENTRHARVGAAPEPYSSKSKATAGSSL